MRSFHSQDNVWRLREVFPLKDGVDSVQDARHCEAGLLQLRLHREEVPGAVVQQVTAVLVVHASLQTQFSLELLHMRKTMTWSGDLPFYYHDTRYKFFRKHY